MSTPPSSPGSPTPPPARPSARSPVPPPLRLPRPPGTDAPPTCEVPPFDPVRLRGGRYRLERLVRHRRRAVAAGLAVTAAALVAAGPGTGPEPHGAERPHGHRATEPARRQVTAEPVDMVAAPVRIADAATVRLLRPGDRVDVIAAQDPPVGGGVHVPGEGVRVSGDGVRVLARGVRVTKVPRPPDGSAGTGAAGSTAGGSLVESGALVVLSVPRTEAARLVGVGATARLAVTLC
ncbi:RcpC/CpaB family pilus assembly protein [Streptomyces sp. NPDC013455]|uniref:RcpC/CpaB family pilus assembly protein n=1 Tax=Streptomyces sp. NPDC013455 TaxID=3155605 RepID=UPI003405B862